jgi:hypothetical protein
MRFAAVAAKVETTAGADAIGGSPASSDWIGGDCEVTFQQNAVQNPELTGSLDVSAPIVGGLQTSIRIRVPLRGAGAGTTPGTAPEWGTLMRACTMVETVTASAVTGTATAGTTTSVTLAVAASTTAQIYRGMPIILTGPAETTGITDYTTGRVASLGSTLASAATGTTTYNIPINVRYSPTSDEGASGYRTATVYFYADGLLWRFTGCLGSWSAEFTTGGLGFLVFTMRGQLVSAPTAQAVPSGALGTVRATPPRFVAGRMQFNRLPAQTRSVTVDAGVTTVLPDDPEATEGYGAAVPVERAITGALDPLMNTTLSPTRFSAFQNGTNVPLMVIVGSTAGNRFLLTMPSIRQTQNNPTARDGLGADAIAFSADGADAGVFLAQF